MRKRTRKLIGTALMLAFVVIYGPFAMALADSRIAQAPQLVQTLAYLRPRADLDPASAAADPVDGEARLGRGVTSRRRPPRPPCRSRRRSGTAGR